MLAEPGEQRLHVGLDGGRLDAAVGVDDDVDRVAGLGREAVLQQLLGLARSPSRARSSRP